MIPGADILGMALTVIAKQQFEYYRYKSREEQSQGLDVATYYAPVTAYGSVQPVPRELYEQQGLPLQKTYFNFFVEKNILDVERGVSGDQFSFAGATYQAISVTPWYCIDGWVQVLCVRVGGSDA